MWKDGHEYSFAGGLEAVGVLVRAEDVDCVIGVSECFEAFEACLAVVEGGGAHV